MKNAIRLVSLVGLALWLPGCSLKPIDSGETSYGAIAGTYKAVEAAPFKNVLKATMEAMQSLQLRPMVHDNDAFKALIVGESVFGKISQTHEIRVHIRNEGEAKTEIEMRIVGRRDEDRLRTIHAEIRKRLGTSG